MDDPIRLFIQKITKLPTLPAIAQEVLNLTFDDSVSIRRLEGIIENDPPIASRILSVSNSAFFGIEKPNESIGNAIVRIGFDNVRQIALGIALLSVFRNGTRSHPLDPVQIFKHSVAVGMIARFLAIQFKRHDQNEIFACGILHDLGILVMNSYAEEMYFRVIDSMQREESLLDAETRVLGFTHTTVGAWLAEKWNLPDAVLATIRFHHDPLLSNSKQIALIYLADCICSARFFCATEYRPVNSIDDSVFDRFNISRADFTAIESTIDESMFSEGIFIHE
jgi:putative nucleotidyltransferase with HDIG domain